MKRTSRLHLPPIACATLLAAVLSPPANAQDPAERWSRAGTWTLTAELGGAAFSDFQRGRARPVDESVELGEFERRVSGRTSTTVGARATYWLFDGWGVRVGAAFVPSGFSVWNEEAAQRVLDERGTGEPAVYAPLRIWMADLAAVFRLPRVFGRVAPYGVAGGGVVRYGAGYEAELPPEARSRFAGGVRTGAAAVVGVGGAIPLQRRSLLLSFEITNHMTRTPLDDTGAGERFELGGVPLQLVTEPERGGTDGVGLTSNLRLVVGLTLPVRGTLPRR